MSPAVDHLQQHEPSHRQPPIGKLARDSGRVVADSEAVARLGRAECQQPKGGGDVAVAIEGAADEDGSGGEADYQHESGDSVVLVPEDDEEEEEEETANSSSDDVDSDVEENEDALKGHGWLTANDAAKPADHLQLQREMNGVALPTSSDPSAYGDISFTNCSGVQVGPRTFYKGPVTIKQFVYTNSSPLSEDKISACSDRDSGSRHGLTCNGTDGAKLSQGSGQPIYAFTSQRVAEWCTLKRFLLTLGATVLALILIIVLSVQLTLNSASGTTYPPVVPAHPNDTSINNVPTIPGVHFIRRVEWGAQPPKSPANKLEIDPPTYIIISHTASEFCYTQSQCVLIVRVAQTFHMESRGWDDIGYNFLIGGDGLVYEGRGWGVEGAHTYNYNVKSIGISFIGTFNDVEPTPAQLHAAKKLIEFAEENGYVSKDYKLLGHRQCIKTESPGEKLYNIIKTWDHWSPTP